MDIASVFYNATEDGKEYFSIALDDVVKEIFPELKELKISMKEIPAENRTDNSPFYRISIYKPKPKDKKE